MPQAQHIADIIMRGFRRHFRLFQQITANAQQRFAAADWSGFLTDNAERISYYDARVSETIAALQQELPVHCLDEALWQQVKQHYLVYLQFHPQAELAETFYNSVFCQLFDRQYFHNQNIFVESTLSKQQLPAPSPRSMTATFRHRTACGNVCAVFSADLAWVCHLKIWTVISA